MLDADLGVEVGDLLGNGIVEVDQVLLVVLGLGDLLVQIIDLLLKIDNLGIVVADLVVDSVDLLVHSKDGCLESCNVVPKSSDDLVGLIAGLRLSV